MSPDLRLLLPLRAPVKRWIDSVERKTRKDLTGVGKRKQRAEALARREFSVIRHLTFDPNGAKLRPSFVAIAACGHE